MRWNLVERPWHELFHEHLNMLVPEVSQTMMQVMWSFAGSRYSSCTWLNSLFDTSKKASWAAQLRILRSHLMFQKLLSLIRPISLSRTSFVEKG